MDIKDLKQKPIWQMTGEELLYLQQYATIPQATSRKIHFDRDRSEKSEGKYALPYYCQQKRPIKYKEIISINEP